MFRKISPLLVVAIAVGICVISAVLFFYVNPLFALVGAFALFALFALSHERRESVYREMFENTPIMRPMSEDVWHLEESAFSLVRGVVYPQVYGENDTPVALPPDNIPLLAYFVGYIEGVAVEAMKFSKHRLLTVGNEEENQSIDRLTYAGIAVSSSVGQARALLAARSTLRARYPDVFTQALDDAGRDMVRLTTRASEAPSRLRELIVGSWSSAAQA